MIAVLFSARWYLSCSTAWQHPTVSFVKRFNIAVESCGPSVLYSADSLYVHAGHNAVINLICCRLILPSSHLSSVNCCLTPSLLFRQPFRHSYWGRGNYTSTSNPIATGTDPTQFSCGNLTGNLEMKGVVVMLTA